MGTKQARGNSEVTIYDPGVQHGRLEQDGGGTATDLQQVTEAGATTNQPITVETLSARIFLGDDGFGGNLDGIAVTAKDASSSNEEIKVNNFAGRTMGIGIDEVGRAQVSGVTPWGTFSFAFLGAADARLEASIPIRIGGAGFKVGALADANLAVWTSIRRASANIVSAAIAAGATASQTIAVTGAVVGAEVIVGGPSTLEAGLLLYAYVSTTNQVTLRVANNTAGSITPAAGQAVSVVVLNP